MYLPHTATLSDQETFTLAAREEDCGFEGNSDLYGLGIRLGIYMQWASSFMPRPGSQSLALLMKTYFIFIFAIFVAVLVLTVEKRPTYMVEIFILTSIIFGGAYTILMANWRNRNTPTNVREQLGVSRVSFLAFLCLFDAVAFYCCWFWLHGIRKDNFLATPCGSHAFVFANASLSNRVTTKALAILSGLIGVSPMVFIVNFLVDFCIKRPLPDELARPQPDDDEYRRVTEVLEEKIGFIEGIAKAFYLIYFILGIELTLYWNRVTHVYSVDTAGQLIPLIIGLCGLAQFLYKPPLRRFMEWKNGNTEIPVAQENGPRDHVEVGCVEGGED